MSLINYRIRSTLTGLWLVAPVSTWKDRCKPEWTEIEEASYQFSPRAAADQLNYLWWGVSERCKRCRVAAPYTPPENTPP